MWFQSSLLVFILGFIGQLDGAVDLVAIFRNVRPFGIPNTNVFHQATFDGSTSKLSTSLDEYGNISVGTGPLKYHEDSRQTNNYQYLVELFNDNGTQFEADLRAKCPTEFQLLQRVNFKPTPEEKHKAVFDDFLLNQNVIQAVVELLNRKIMYGGFDLKNYQDCQLFDEISSFDILGIQAQRQLIHSISPISPNVLRAALVLQNNKLKDLIFEKIILKCNNLKFISSFFSILNGAQDCKLHEKLVFSDKYDEIVRRGVVSADDLVSAWFEFFFNAWSYVEASCNNERDIKGLPENTQTPGVLNKHRLRELLLNQLTYNKKNISPNFAHTAFDFKPATWDNLPSIQAKLNEIKILGNPASQCSLAKAILLRAGECDEEVGIGSPHELKKSLLGAGNLFERVSDSTKARLLCSLQDLQDLECKDLKEFMSSLDFFSFKSIAAFYKNPGFEIKMNFTKEDYDRAYKRTSFLLLNHKIGTAIPNLQYLKDVLRVVAKESETCPYLSLGDSLNYSLEDLRTKSNEEVLKGIFSFTINYVAKDPAAVLKFEKSLHLWQLDLMLEYATVFEGAENIFEKALLGKDLGREDFELISIGKLELYLSQIDSDFAKATQVVLAFAGNKKFAKFYRKCISRKVIAAINPLSVVNFINSIDSIVAVINLIEYEDLDEIITGKFPTYFETFSQLDFFGFTCLAVANVPFMVEMKNQLNWGIVAMKNAEKKFAIWKKIAKITDARTIFMRRSRKSLGVPEDAPTTAPDYAKIAKRIMKKFVKFVNSETQEMGILEFIEYLDENCKFYSSPFLQKLSSVPFFGVEPEEGFDFPVPLSANKEHELEKKFKATATRLGLTVEGLIGQLSRLTSPSSATTYRIGKIYEIEKVWTYPDAIEQMMLYHRDYLNQMVALTKNNQTEEPVKLFDNELSPSYLALLAFSQDFFSVNEKFSTQQLAITWELSFVAQEIEGLLRAAAVSLDDVALIEASKRAQFFEADSTLLLLYKQLIKASEPESFVTILLGKDECGESLLSKFLTAYKASLGQGQEEEDAIEEPVEKQSPYVARKIQRRKKPKYSDAKYLIILFGVFGGLILLFLLYFWMSIQADSGPYYFSPSGRAEDKAKKNELQE